MSVVQTVVLAGAVLTSGVVAGLFFGYAISVMPALAGADDRTVVDVMQRINVAILNPWFGAVFGGALVLGVAALTLDLVGGPRDALPWLVAGLACYVAMLVVTGVVHVPLNNQLAAAGPVAEVPDLAAVRQEFERRWVPWNVVRAVLSVGSFASLLIALLVASPPR